MGRNRKHTGKKQHFCTNGYPETIIWRESYRISDQKKLLTKLPKERGCTHLSVIFQHQIYNRRPAH